MGSQSYILAQSTHTNQAQLLHLDRKQREITSFSEYISKMSSILACLLVLSFINAQSDGSRLSSPYHRHSFLSRNSRDRGENGSENLRIVKQLKGVKRSDDLEEQVERSVEWNGESSWRSRVRQYLEKRRGSIEGGVRVESREIDGPGDKLLAEVIEMKDEEKKEPEKDMNILSTFLSPPSGDVQLGDDTWREAFDTKTETTSTSTTEEKIEITTSEATTADLFENLANTTLDILNDLDEVRELSVKAKTTLAKLQEFKNATKPTKCQSATDCKSNQVCYLPTNECKDQLTFSLRERSSCTNSEDCETNEVCYLSTSKCVCNLGYIEKSGTCVSMKNLNCTETTSSKVIDSAYWGVQPYCSAWGNNTAFGDENAKLSFGTFQSGTGVGSDPMVFSGGSKKNCGVARNAELVYECYCDEYSCSTEPAWNKTALWWGEFNPCTYSAYVFTPLACPTKVG